MRHAAGISAKKHQEGNGANKIAVPKQTERFSAASVQPFLFRQTFESRMKTPSDISFRITTFVAAVCVILFGSGCTNVSVTQQRLLSKPNMVFSDSSVFDYGATAYAYVEPGTSSSGGAQASGCTACK